MPPRLKAGGLGRQKPERSAASQESATGKFPTRPSLGGHPEEVTNAFAPELKALAYGCMIGAQHRDVLAD
jgi:hypothetical protein